MHSKYNEQTLASIVIRDNDEDEITQVVRGVFPDARGLDQYNKGGIYLLTAALKKDIYLPFYPDSNSVSFIQCGWAPQHRPFSVITEPTKVYWDGRPSVTLPTLYEALVYARLTMNR